MVCSRIQDTIVIVESEELQLRRQIRSYNQTAQQLEEDLAIQVPLVKWTVARFSPASDFDSTRFHIAAFLRINGDPLTCTFWLSWEIVADKQVSVIAIAKEAFVSAIGRAILAWKPVGEEPPETE